MRTEGEDLMRRIVRLPAVPTVAVVVGLLGGFSLGQRRGLGVGTKLLEMETGGTLSAHVEVASAIRVGDTDRALELLDRMIDSAVLSLSAQPGPLAAAGSMGQAKVYRSVVPPSGASASSVKAALSRVSPPEGPPYSAPERQGSALGKLVTRSAG